MEQHPHYGLLQVALRAVVEASSEILHIYHKGFSPKYKLDGSPVTMADLVSNEIIEGHLKPTGIPLLTEESVHAPFDERRTWPQFWSVDPLDGTKEFIKRNDEFAINIALIEGTQPVLGIVASPVEGLALIGGKYIAPALVRFDAVPQPEAWQLLEKRTEPNSPLVIASSRSPHSGPALEFIQRIQTRFGNCTFLRKGSALKFIDLAVGTADLYPRFAPTMEWDIAAGQAIIESLGGSVTNALSGETLYYNKADLLNPYFVVHNHAVRQHLDAHA
jgi:3'(2'), 5'-bisphosphate nucleotidase